MPESVLTLLKLCLVAVLYLFFFRVLRAVWFEMRSPTPLTPGPTPAAAPAQRATVPRGAPVAAVGPATHLTVTAPPELAGLRFELGATEVTIGRGQGCAILIGDQTVSSIHARIAASGSGPVIEDLKSRNGTFVNKTRVTGPTPLRAGDRVGIGPVVVLEAG